MTDARRFIRRSSLLFKLSVLCVFCLDIPTEASDTGLADIPEDGSLALLLSWISGDFDNRTQVETQDTSEDAQQEPLFSHLGLQRRRVEVPALGEYVVYAQINRNADPSDIYRQTLQVFRENAVGTISSTNYRLQNPERHRDLLARPEAFATLTQADLVTALPGECDPLWTWEQGEFVARIDARQCVMISRRDGKPRRIQSTEFVGRDMIRNEESGYRENGEQIFGLPDGIYYRYERVVHAP